MSKHTEDVSAALYAELTREAERQRAAMERILRLAARLSDHDQQGDDDADARSRDTRPH